MERKLQERMIGAGILVLGLVVFGPMILDGGTPPSGTTAVPAVPGEEEVRTQTFRLDQSSSPPSGVMSPAEAVVQEPERAVEPAAVRSPESRPQTTPAEPPQQPVRAPPVEPRPAAPPVAHSAPVAKTGQEKPVSQPDAAATGKPVAGGQWLVQVGAFGQKVNAERLASTLRAAGFRTTIRPVAGGGKTLYGVRVGPVGSPQEAAVLARRLAAAGHPGRVVSQE